MTNKEIEEKTEYIASLISSLCLATQTDIKTTMRVEEKLANKLRELFERIHNEQ